MKSILLITSQASIRDDFTRMLCPYYRMCCADSEEEGLQVLKEKPGDIVAVLIELALARKSGFAFAERLREIATFSPIPMIAISAALPVPSSPRKTPASWRSACRPVRPRVRGRAAGGQGFAVHRHFPVPGARKAL